MFYSLQLSSNKLSNIENCKKRIYMVIMYEKIKYVVSITQFDFQHVKFDILLLIAIDNDVVVVLFNCS